MTPVENNMTTPYFPADSLVTLAEQPGTLFLCATSRLVQHLREQQASQCMAAGMARWNMLQSRTVDQWLGELMEEAGLRGLLDEHVTGHDLFQRQVLEPMQEHLVWIQVISESLGSGISDFFDVDAMARQAMDAQRLAGRWDVDLAVDDPKQEALMFMLWREQFLNLCDERGWIDRQRLLNVFVAQLPALTMALPTTVVMAGFDRHNAVEHSLLDALRFRGITVGALEKNAPAVSVELRAFADAAAEIQAAAQWARATLEAHPRARIGIVVPDIKGAKRLLSDTFEDVFDPALLRPAFVERARSFNISLGDPLRDYPLVSTALALLRISVQPHAVKQADLQQLLNNPLWSEWHHEADLRARLDARMRKRLPPRLSLRAFADAFAVDHPGVILFEHVRSLEDGFRQHTARQAPSRWAKHFVEVLNASGWLFSRTLSSREYQTFGKFHEVCGMLAGIDHVQDKIDAASALRHLETLCEEQVFQPKTQGRPPVRILGLLETSGLRFDALWVSGMTDRVWPPPPNPNPLLPLDAQVKAGCPNASVAIQNQFAKSLHDGLLSAAPVVVFSWPQAQNGTACSASPLLSPIDVMAEIAAPANAVWPAGPEHWIGRAMRCQERFAEPLQDDRAPAVEEGQELRGGTGLLKAQAICPAWGFYQYRLGARELDEAVEGLDAGDRGTLVHHALKHIWSTLGNSVALCNLQGQHDTLINAAIHHALAAWESDPDNAPLPARFRDLEIRRLGKLLEQWLQKELERTTRQNTAYFEVVNCELEVQVDIHGIRARMQIDRIDVVDVESPNEGEMLAARPGARKMVMDYKTGASVDIKNWNDVRIKEPQLPIYALLASIDDLTVRTAGKQVIRLEDLDITEASPVKAVAFAKVLLKKPGFAGLAEDKGYLPSVSGVNEVKTTSSTDNVSPWQRLLIQWHESIHNIAGEIKRGDAGVWFDDEKWLRYCPVLPLLRLGERREQFEMSYGKAGSKTKGETV